MSQALLAQTLKAALDAGDVAASDADFARSLLAGFARYGSFTPRQEPHVLRLVARAANPRAPDPSAVTLPDVSGIMRLLMRAKARGLKRPGFTLTSHAGDMRLSLAPDTGKNPGHVYVKLAGAYAGKIAPDGRFSVARDVTLQQHDMDKLAQMARDPAGTAASYGHQTGACCFCSRSLDDPRSVAVGYGPICADKYDLPHGQ